jgi:hypothetical protein
LNSALANFSLTCPTSRESYSAGDIVLDTLCYNQAFVSCKAEHRGVSVTGVCPQELVFPLCLSATKDLPEWQVGACTAIEVTQTEVACQCTGAGIIAVQFASVSRPLEAHFIVPMETAPEEKSEKTVASKSQDQSSNLGATAGIVAAGCVVLIAVIALIVHRVRKVPGRRIISARPGQRAGSVSQLVPGVNPTFNSQRLPLPQLLHDKVASAMKRPTLSRGHSARKAFIPSSGKGSKRVLHGGQKARTRNPNAHESKLDRGIPTAGAPTGASMPLSQAPQPQTTHKHKDALPASRGKQNWGKLRAATKAASATKQPSRERTFGRKTAGTFSPQHLLRTTTAAK